MIHPFPQGTKVVVTDPAGEWDQFTGTVADAVGSEDDRDFYTQGWYLILTEKETGMFEAPPHAVELEPQDD